jgi:beta-N-acetylhexosaminidase
MIVQQTGIGPLMIDLAGTEITLEEREWLAHPAVGAVILFTRNYENRPQLIKLTSEIRAIKEPALLIAVDQEGGRVQRFRNEFIQYPALRRLGDVYEHDPSLALKLSELFAWSLACELNEVGVDFSFAPILDVCSTNSTVIGDRAFHEDNKIVSTLAEAFVQGLNKGGMQAVGKHFPGHGSVQGDSHYILPVDHRTEYEIREIDLPPFNRLIKAGIAGIMSAHVVYKNIEDVPASFSHYWLTSVLRDELKYQGVIFSDDLTMQGAQSYGDMPKRIQSALDAGSDMILICNSPQEIPAALEKLSDYKNDKSSQRLAKFYAQKGLSMRQDDKDLLQNFIDQVVSV